MLCCVKHILRYNFPQRGANNIFICRFDPPLARTLLAEYSAVPPTPLLYARYRKHFLASFFFAVYGFGWFALFQGLLALTDACSVLYCTGESQLERVDRPRGKGPYHR